MYLLQIVYLIVNILSKIKNGKNINYLMIFDIYFKNNMDLRERILNRSQQEKLEGRIEESRFEVLDDCMEIFDKSLEKEKIII